MLCQEKPICEEVKKIKKIYIVEDEKLLRELFTEFIEMLFPKLEIVGNHSDGDEALKECIILKPDLVILDIWLPEVNGLEILVILKRKFPDIKILMITGNPNDRNIRLAVDAGADGFVEKSGGLDELKNGVETIMDGKNYYSPNIIKIAPYLLNQDR